jgi:hypothetical protein
VVAVSLFQRELTVLFCAGLDNNFVINL